MEPDEALRKKQIRAWCMYDWANSAFATTIMAAMFPPFYRRLAVASGLAENTATAYWAYTIAAALLVIAVIGPVLGAISDYTGGKKRYVGLFAGLGILCTAAFLFIGKDTWLLASILFACANIGFAGANVFYESLLPHIARKDDIDQISAKGYALGYAGGGILLVINALWYMKPELFGMPDRAFALRASFLSVSLWWATFAIPLFRRVPEPPAARETGPAINPVKAGLSRLATTFHEIKRYRQLLLFLVAFWIYNDGISTIIKMATAYGDEIGIELTHMIVALIITQFVGIPCSFLFGRLAKVIGAKRSILLALGVYALICIGAYSMQTATHFYILAFAVGLVQGGSQALSRSLFASMVPKTKSAEFFAFFNISGKFAGIAGPLVFAVVSQRFGTSRLSIVALIAFFVVGAAILSRVDQEKGVVEAQAVRT